MRTLLWILVGITCLMLAGCPKKDAGATGGTTPPAGENNSGDATGE
jgi:hypothetical protein